MKSQKDEVHPMVRAYMAKLGRRSQEKNKRTPEQMSELARLRWTRARAKIKKLLETVK